MANDDMRRRLADVDEELARIRRSIPQDRSHLGRLRKAASFCEAYWEELLGLLFARCCGWICLQSVWHYVLRAVYREAKSAKKQLAAAHRRLGDRLLALQEWPAAAGAYRQAMQVYPYDDSAAMGLVKADVFVPESGQSFYAPEVVDGKLEYLIEKFPDDYVVQYLLGLRQWDRGERDAAVASMRTSIKANPRFAGGYLALGYFAQNRFDLEEAILNYKKALEADTLSALAYNNAGFLFVCWSDDYSDATRYLRRAQAISPTMQTMINLGDAYRYAGEYDTAVVWHEYALQLADGLAKDYQRFFGRAVDIQFHADRRRRFEYDQDIHLC